MRAAPGGTGAAKCGGNYAASLLAQAQAAEQGCDQVVWLDAVERRWVEEMGGMNLFFVFGSGATPGRHARADRPLLAGITRDSLLELADDAGLAGRGAADLQRGVGEDGRAGGSPRSSRCGTAAVITPVGAVKHADGEFMIGGGAPGAVDDAAARRADRDPARDGAGHARLDAHRSSRPA